MKYTFRVLVKSEFIFVREEISDFIVDIFWVKSEFSFCKD